MSFLFSVKKEEKHSATMSKGNEDDLPPPDPNMPRRQQLIVSRRGFKSAFTVVRKRLEADLHDLENPATLQDATRKRRLLRGLPATLTDLERRFGRLEKCQTEILNLFGGLDGDPDPEENAIDGEYGILTDLRGNIEDIRIMMDDGDASSIGSNVSHASGAAAGIGEISKILAYNLEPSKEIRSFDGKGQRSYIQFRTWLQQWKSMETRLLNLGRTKTQIFQSMKQTLKGMALDLVDSMEENEAMYDVALVELQKVWGDGSMALNSCIRSLLNLKEAEKDDAQSLMSLYSTLCQANNTFSGLQLSAEQLSTLLFVSLAENKLDDRTKKIWKKTMLNHPNPNTVTRQDFLDVVLSQAKLQKAMNPDKPKGKDKDKDKKEKPDGGKGSKQHCELCDRNNHSSGQCLTVQRLDKSEVLNLLKEKQLCGCCLQKRGQQHQCRGKCQKQGCKEPHRHHSILHKIFTSEVKRDNKKSLVADTSTEETVENDEELTVNHASPRKSTGMLRTCTGLLVHPTDGSSIKVNFLLDSGCSGVLVKRDKAESLGLDGPSCTVTLELAGGKSTRHPQEKRVSFAVASIDGSYTSPVVTGTTIGKICAPTAAVNFDPGSFPHLKGLPFTESYPRSRQIDIDCLIGEPLFTALQVGGPITGGLHEPAAQKTKLGYVLCGSNPKCDSSVMAMNFTTLFTKVKTPDLTDFWKMEHLGLTDEDDSLTAEELAAVTKMEETTYLKDKRWYTSLLWKDDIDPKMELGSNFMKAKKVMESVERRVAPEHKDLVCQAYDAFEEKDFAEDVPDDEVFPADNRMVYYLETHPVIKLDRDSTKARIVVNAASRNRHSKKSLNDCLLAGPNLLKTIPEVVMRFRQHKYVLTYDLKSMFLQIFLHSDKDSLRYLWRNMNIESKSLIKRMKCISFGVVTSPYQAIFCVFKLAELNLMTFKEAAMAILENTYMDDSHAGGDSEEELSLIFQDILDILSQGSFQAHKVASNAPAALGKVPKDMIVEDEVVKVLGSVWNKKDDTLGFDFVEKMAEEVHTKRELLKEGAQFYDANGILCPLINNFRQLMVESWALPLEWDDPLPQDIQKKWTEWVRDLTHIKSISIPRWTGMAKGNKTFIAAFGDASKDCYGTAVYAVTKDAKTNEVHSTLVFAKSRMAPKELRNSKPLTIVRLELLAAVITARAAVYTAQALGVEEQGDVHCFSDSMITLLRIQAGHSGYRVWVANKIKAIEEKVRSHQFHFVPGHQNPSDLASRLGMKATSLFQGEIPSWGDSPEALTTFWVNGPAFLKLDPSQWPQQPVRAKNKQALELDQEERKPFLPEPLYANLVTEGDRLLDLPSRVEAWLRMVRITAYCYRFLDVYFKGAKPSSKALSVTEIRQAEKFWITLAQKVAFAKEWDALKEGDKVEKASPLYGLDPIFKTGMIVSRSRLRLSETLPDSTMYPIILPRHNSIVEKLVIHFHRCFCHCSADFLLGNLLVKFHLIGGRKEVKRIIRTCKVKNCRTIEPINQAMGPLPPERIDNPQSWCHISIDFCGHFFTTVDHCSAQGCSHNKEEAHNHPPMKRYCLIATCLAARLVAVEMVHSLTTEELLLALRRLFARTSVPVTIFSDCGSQLRAADRELQRLLKRVDWEKIKADKNLHGIDWQPVEAKRPVVFKYSVPLGHHQQGTVERLIRPLKRSLTMSLQGHIVSDATLSTTLQEIAAMLNHRPITRVYDPEKGMDLPLTPNHLLYGRGNNILPTALKDVTKVSSFAECWKTRQMLLSKFWRKWSRLYLLQLSPQKKWVTRHEDPVKVGDVVLLLEDKLPKNVWKLARITELHRGKDDLIRSVSVMLPSKSVVRRHLNRISLLEANA